MALAAGIRSANNGASANEPGPPMSLPAPVSVATVALMTALAVAGCAGNGRPILYPGTGPAQVDVNRCMRLAQAAGANPDRGRDIARDTAWGAVMGGAASGIYGAVRGYEDAAESAAAGAAAGASVGLLRGLMLSTGPSPTYRAYVERCLAESGHDVIGWR